MPTKPKIAIFHRYPPEFELVPCPGWEPIVKNLSLRYDLVHIGMKWNNPPGEKFRKYLKVVEIPLKINLSSGLDKWFKTFLYYFYLPAALMKIKKERPAVIMCREIFPFVNSIVGILKVPMIIEISDWWPSVLLGNSKLGMKIADFIESSEVKHWAKLNVIAVAHNNFETELLLKRGMPNKKIARINLPMYGGIYSPHNSKELRKKLGFKEDDFILALHGIIHKSKGYDQVLEWWAKLANIHPNWKLLFIGGTMGEGWFKKMIKDLHLEKNVLVTGWISDQNKLNSLLNTADCLLATRRNTPDTWGNTPSALTHNLMVGKPTVSTGTPGISEVIQTGKNGYLFEPDNYRSFKSILEYVYAHPKESRKVGKKGMERVKEYFDADKELKSYLKILDNLKNN
jgi:glycosyltransferase involved in cell wall biosynthesis